MDYQAKNILLTSMGITDNFTDLLRLKRDLGINVDKNPVAAYLSGSILIIALKSYIKETYHIEGFKFLGLSEKNTYKIHEPFIYEQYLTQLDIINNNIISIQNRYKCTLQKANQIFNMDQEIVILIRNKKKYCNINKIYGLEGVIQAVANLKQFNKLYKIHEHKIQ
jgi:hypothetical protein